MAPPRTPALWTVEIGGWVENVIPLPDGDILVSALGRGLVQRIDGTTHEVTTIAEVADPGGLARHGDTLHVATGNSVRSAVTRAGGVVAIDLTTGAQRSVVTGLGQVNGLARLPGGDLVLTVTVGRGAGVQRVDPATGSARRLTSAVRGANGIAVGPAGQVYAGSTLAGTIIRVDPDTGEHARAAGVSPLLDDVDVLPDGRIVAATTLGHVDLLDPATGRRRTLSRGHLGATSARLAADGTVIVSTIGGRVLALDLAP